MLEADDFAALEQAMQKAAGETVPEEVVEPEAGAEPETAAASKLHLNRSSRVRTAVSCPSPASPPAWCR
ncbi:hypothetical protein V6L77_16135 [Pannonibacter sp. Pt2-lr]